MANQKNLNQKSIIAKEIAADKPQKKDNENLIRVAPTPKQIKSNKAKSSKNPDDKTYTAVKSKEKTSSPIKSVKGAKSVTGGETTKKKAETTDSNGAYSDALKGYMANIIQYPLISRQEEVELAAQIHGDDPEVSAIARETLINANLRLVVKIAHDFKGFGLPLIDLVSEGNIGLMRASDKFDPAKGAKFSSYAAWWIKQSMRRALANQSRTIRIPVQSATKINKIRSAQMVLTEKLGREPNYAEIALHLDFSLRTVISLSMAAPKTISIHDPIQQGEDGEIQDIIPDYRVVMPDQIIADTESRQRLLVVMKDLDDRERQIIKMRFGLGNTPIKTLEDVSQIVGRTRERVRQIQNQALMKMRGWLIDEAGYAAN